MSPMRRGGGRGLSQWVQLCTWCPNKLWRSTSISNALIAIYEMSLKTPQITCKSPDFHSTYHQKSFITRGFLTISDSCYIIRIISPTYVLEETLYGNIHTPSRNVCVEKLRSSIGVSCPHSPLKEDWMLRGPRSSSFWVPRNLSRHMTRQARSDDTSVCFKSREMTGRTQTLPWWLGGGEKG